MHSIKSWEKNCFHSDYDENNSTIPSLVTSLEQTLSSRKERKLSALTPTSPYKRRRKRSKRSRGKQNLPSSITPDTVINLSNVPLSEDETSLLNKGLNFCPTPLRVSTFQLEFDLAMFYRRLRLREYFHNGIQPQDTNTGEVCRHPFRITNKSWTPAKNRQHALEAYIEAVDEQAKVSNTRVRDNLSQSERRALHSLH